MDHKCCGVINIRKITSCYVEGQLEGLVGIRKTSENPTSEIQVTYRVA